MQVDYHQPESPAIEPGSSVKVPEIRWKTNLGFDETVREFSRGSRFGGRSYQMIAWSVVAATIDFLVVISLSLLFLASFALISKAGLLVILQSFEFSVGTKGLLHFLGYFALGFFLLYLIMMRIFLGYTIGEWACDLRLGSLQQRLNSNYSLRVLARTGLLLMTGVLTLPILSIITGRDICGGLVGLRLVRKK